MTSGGCHAKVATVPGAGLHHVEEVLWTALAFAKAAALEHCF